MRIRYVFVATMLMALPLAGAFAQGGTMPHINANEAKEWANDNNNHAKKSHPTEAQSKAMPSTHYQWSASHGRTG